MPKRPSRIAARALTALVVVVSACSGGGDAEEADGTDTPSVASTALAGSMKADHSTQAPDGSTTTLAPIPSQPDPACAEAPDRKITDLADLVLPAVSSAPIDLPEVTVADEVIPAVHVPGFSIPQQTIDGGCLIEYAAPGGCLGAFEMTGVSIPEVRLPGYVLDEVSIDGRRVADGVVREPVVIAGSSTPTVRREVDCEIVRVAEENITALVREPLVRPAVVRLEGAFAPATRPPICVDGECVGALDIRNVVVPYAMISEVVIPELVVQVGVFDGAPETDVIAEDGRTSYLAPVDVLFDVDAADLRPEAIPTLEAIAAEIRRAPAGAGVTVDGHTDSDGDDTYNDDLSVRRAQAVADWLTSEGGIEPGRIVAAGLGERFPVASNDTPEGKAMNRRVVISVGAEEPAG